jgi:hypothetical protein
MEKSLKAIYNKNKVFLSKINTVENIYNYCRENDISFEFFVNDAIKLIIFDKGDELNNIVGKKVKVIKKNISSDTNEIYLKLNNLIHFDKMFNKENEDIIDIMYKIFFPKYN